MKFSFAILSLPLAPSYGAADPTVEMGVIRSRTCVSCHVTIIRLAAAQRIGEKIGGEFARRQGKPRILRTRAIRSIVSLGSDLIRRRTT